MEEEYLAPTEISYSTPFKKAFPGSVRQKLFPDFNKNVTRFEGRGGKYALCFREALLGIMILMLEREQYFVQ